MRGVRFWLRVWTLFRQRQREQAKATMDFNERYKMHIVTTPWEELPGGSKSTAPKPVVKKIATPVAQASDFTVTTTAFAAGLAKINTWPDPAQPVLPFPEPEPTPTPEEVAEASQVEMATLWRAATDAAYRSSLWAMMDDKRHALLWSEYSARQAEVIAQYKEFEANVRAQEAARAAIVAAHAVPQPRPGARLIDLEE